MAKKISELNPLTGGILESTDKLVMVDQSGNETKRINLDEFAVGLPTLAVDTDTLVVDEVNKHIGIGTVSPEATLHVETSDIVTGYFESTAGLAIFAMADKDGSIAIRAQNGRMQVYTGGDGGTGGVGATEAFRVNTNGAFLHGTTVAGSAGAGDIVVNGGIFLGGSAAANELNDYEKGTFTPVFKDGSDNEPTYVIQKGWYTKTGDDVFFTIEMSISSLGAMSGATARIEDLPFISTNIDGSQNWSIMFGYAAGLSITAGNSLTGYIYPNDSVIIPQIWSAITGTIDVSVSDFTSDMWVTITGKYTAA